MFDTKYSWNKETVNNFYPFKGYLDTIMFYDEEHETWNLHVYGADHVVATVNATDYPFGTLDWDVLNDLECTEGENGTQVVTLNVNACKSDEFNCGDGSCVSINVRCDGDIDCQDKTGRSLA